MNFIKLSSRVINTKYIQLIKYNNDEFFIYLHENNAFGFFALGVGTMWANNDYIKISKKININDYKIIKDWVDKN